MTNAQRRVVVGVISVGILLALASPVAAQAPSSTDLRDAVDEWASEIGAPGMTARIVDIDGVVSEASTGSDGNGDAIDETTAFVWGSVSKQLAAAVVAGLERRGVVDAATPVVDVVPQAEQLLGDPAVSVDDLVHHTSGLPHDVTVTDDWSRRKSASDAVASMTRPDGFSERGTFRYSSLNYLVLQAVVEQVTGGSFADAVEREVLAPAGAGAITDPDEFAREVPPGHVPFFGSSKPVDVGVDSAGLGYGYLAGSIDQLSRYASWRLEQLQAWESGVGEVNTGQGTTYGNGLFHENIEGREVWWHSGAVPGYYTYVALVPAANTAMVLTTNRYGEIEADRVAAVGRNLTTLVLAGATTDLPASAAASVLGILLGFAAVLVALALWIATRLFTGRVEPRSFRGAVMRVSITVLVGAILLYGALIGVPSLFGASLSMMRLWAPDVTLALWVLAGAVMLTIATGVLKNAAGYRSGKRSALQNGVGSSGVSASANR